MAIDFSLSPELEAIRCRVRSFVVDVIKPAEERLEADDVRESDRRAYYGVLLDLRRQAREAGI